jgi:hypothetical protein
MTDFASELKELIAKWLGFDDTDESEVVDALMDALDELAPDDDD